VRIEPFPEILNCYQRYEAEATVPKTMRYMHTNLNSKLNAVAKLQGLSDNLVTPCTTMQQRAPKVSPKTPLSAVASYN
jgi:NAD-specific glutamate dehydrogenase